MGNSTSSHVLVSQIPSGDDGVQEKAWGVERFHLPHNTLLQVSKPLRAEHMNHYEKPKRAFAQTAFAPSNLLQQVHGEPPLAQKSSPLH